MRLHTTVTCTYSSSCSFRHPPGAALYDPIPPYLYDEATCSEDDAEDEAESVFQAAWLGGGRGRYIETDEEEDSNNEVKYNNH